MNTPDAALAKRRARPTRQSFPVQARMTYGTLDGRSSYNLSEAESQKTDLVSRMRRQQTMGTEVSDKTRTELIQENNYLQ